MTDSALADADVRASMGGAGVSIAASRTSLLSGPARLALWVVGFLLALLLSAWYAQGRDVHNDFTQNVWLPARLVLDGVDPYNPTREQVDAALGAFSGDFTEFNSGADYKFIYPIWLALLFTPFGAMPLVAATTLWRAVNLLVLVWSVGALLRSSNPSFRSLRPAVTGALVITVLLALISRETLLTLIIGQFSILELGLLALLWASLAASPKLPVGGSWPWTREVVIGVALAALATKPQSVGLPVLLVGLWAISRGRWIIPASALGVTAALLLAPALVYPWWLGSWWGVVAGGQAQSQAPVSASVWGLAYQWLGSSSPWGLVALAATFAGLAALVPWWRRDLKDRVSPAPLALPVTLCINSLISPYLLGYEHVLLLLPAVVILAAAGLPGEQQSAAQARDRRLWRMAIYTWMVVLPLLVVVVQAAIDREYPAVAQSVAMLALCWVGKLKWEEAPTSVGDAV